MGYFFARINVYIEVGDGVYYYSFSILHCTQLTYSVFSGALGELQFACGQ